MTGSAAARLVGVAAAWAGLALAMGAGLAWRWSWWDLPPTSDEVGNLTMARGWLELMGEQESGVNPPLLRAVNLWTAPSDTIRWGRWASMVASVAAIPAGFAVAWSASRRSWLAPYWAVAAASWMACHPWVARYGTLYRSYALWSLTSLVLVYALGRMGGAGARRSWAVVGAIAAVLLPWWHYLGVPVLIGVATALLLTPGERWRAWVPVAGLAGIAPMAPAVLSATGRRVAPGESMEETLRKLTSMGLHPPDWFRQVWWDPVGRATDVYPPLGDIMGGAFVCCGLLALWGWRRLSLEGRVAWGGLAGFGLAVLVVGRHQAVRPATIVMVATWMVPALSALAATTTRRGGQAAWALALTAWVGPSLPPAAEALRARIEDERAVQEVLARIDEWPLDTSPIVMHPSTGLHRVFYLLSGQHPRQARRGPGCEGWGKCMVWEGRVWAGVDRVGDGAAVHGWLVSMDRYRPDGFAAACQERDRGRAWTAWACGATSQALGSRGQAGKPGAGAPVHPPDR